MYLNSGLENEEAVYMASEDGFYKLRGHNIYYERNQMMQDYMISRRDARRVDADVDNKVIHSFRQKMETRKAEAAEEKSMIGFLGMLCSILAVTVLAGGTAMINNYHKMKEMEHVIASALPAGIAGSKPYFEDSREDFSFDSAEPEVIIQEESKNSQIVPETMAAESSDGPSEEDSDSQTAGSIGETGSEASGGSESSARQVSESSEASEGGQSGQVFAVPESGAWKSIYEVQEGETLYSICLDKYQDLNMMDEICSLNGLDDKNKIKIGQKLFMP